jgi:hypothetical protein
MYIIQTIKITKIRNAIEPSIKPTTILLLVVVSDENLLQTVPLSLQDIDMLSLKTSNDRKEKNVFF